MVKGWIGWSNTLRVEAGVNMHGQTYSCTPLFMSGVVLNALDLGCTPLKDLSSSGWSSVSIRDAFSERDSPLRLHLAP